MNFSVPCQIWGLSFAEAHIGCAVSPVSACCDAIPINSTIFQLKNMEITSIINLSSQLTVFFVGFPPFYKRFHSQYETGGRRIHICEKEMTARWIPSIFWRAETAIPGANKRSPPTAETPRRCAEIPAKRSGWSIWES